MKDFLLISSINAIAYKEFFPLLKERKVSMGVELPKEYVMPDGTTKKFGNICWYTTLRTPDKKKLILSKKYHHKLYPHYDNYRAIEVSRVKDIPYDYECVMAVPITIFQYDLDNILVKIDEQLKRPLRNKIDIRGIWADDREEADFIVKGTPTYIDEKNKNYQGPVLNGKLKFARVCIILARRKRP